MHALLSRLQEDVLLDEKITTHLRHAAQDALQNFIDHQIKRMSISEKTEAITEIQDLNKMTMSLEVHGEITVEFLLQQIVERKVKMVLEPLLNALSDQDTTQKNLSAVSLNIVRRSLELKSGNCVL